MPSQSKSQVKNTPVKQEAKVMKGGKKELKVKQPVVEPAVEPAVVEPAVVEPVQQMGGRKKGGKQSKQVLEGGKKQLKTKLTKTKVQNKKVVKVSEEKEEESCDKKMRSFKVRLPGDQDFTGRFTGLTPYQAANKALSKYYRDHKDGNLTAVTFTIKESTRGSKRSEYVYNGKREKLAEPVQYPIENAKGEVKTITKSFKNKLTKIKKNELASLVQSV